MSLAYRFEQFWRLLSAAPLTADAWVEIESVLNPQEAALFRRFSRGDRLHSYRVFKTLQQSGYRQPDLLAAALLHDIGKIRYHQSLYDRVIGALGETFLLNQARTWGRGRATGWRRPFAIRCQHAEWGAELAQAAGSSSVTIALIRHHQANEPAHLDGESLRLLRQLQWADDQN